MEKQQENNECGFDSVEALQRIYKRGIHGIMFNVSLFKTEKGLTLVEPLESQLKELLGTYNKMYTNNYIRLKGESPKKVYSWEDILNVSSN